MKTKHTFVTITLMIVVAWSCSSLDPIALDSVNTGSANFARFHVVGDNLTAGMQNGGLVEGFQKVTWAAVIAGVVPSTPHAFPNISENGIPPTMYVASFQRPPRIDTLETLGSPTNLTYPGIYHNMGIPGATLNQLMTKSPGPGDTNPFFGIVLRNPVTFGATAVSQIVNARPTLLAVWAGFTDVFGSAAAGTDAALTPAASFEADFIAMMDSFVVAAGAVVAANIPNFTDVPYFRTIPPVVVNPATGQPVLTPGGDFIPLIGPAGPLSMGDLVTLPASSYLAQGIGIPSAVGGTDQPLPGAVVIEIPERDVIFMRTAQFNAIIDTVCANRGVPVADMNALFHKMATSGYTMRGRTYTTDYLTGGLFGVDGLHPSSLGYYVAALEMIKVINANFGAAIPDPPRPLGPFRDPALGATPAASTTATISPAEWRRLWDTLGVRPRL